MTLVKVEIFSFKILICQTSIIIIMKKLKQSQRIPEIFQGPLVTKLETFNFFDNQVLKLGKCLIKDKILMYVLFSFSCFWSWQVGKLGKKTFAWRGLRPAGQPNKRKKSVTVR